MAIFRGTAGTDYILRDVFSRGVRSDPPGLQGTGATFGNVIWGYGGDDVIEASPGWIDPDFPEHRIGDRIYGGTGDDRLVGALGSDRLNGGAGDDRLVGGGSYDELYGGAGDDVLSGGDDQDLLVGGAGDDRMYGGDGGDNFGTWPDPDAGDDRMVGGSGPDRYMVDSLGDIVVEWDDDWIDTVQTSLAAYVLPENVEDLYVGEDALDGTRARFTGNGKDNGLRVDDDADARLIGLAGDDVLWSAAGDDRLIGGAGRDDLIGRGGADLLSGGSGNDRLAPGHFLGDGADRLIGGRGADLFIFDSVEASPPGQRDVIEAGGGAAAFEGAGAAGGDRIDLGGMDADRTDEDFTQLVFGGTGIGQVSCVDSGAQTLVRANVDDDPGFEFQLLIRDGAIRASAYAATDFILD